MYYARRCTAIFIQSIPNYGDKVIKQNADLTLMHGNEHNTHENSTW